MYFDIKIEKKEKTFQQNQIQQLMIENDTGVIKLY